MIADNLSTGIIILGTLCFSLLIFVLFREVVCWYWKINSRDESLKKISDEISIIRSLLENTVKGVNQERPMPKHKDIIDNDDKNPPEWDALLKK